MTALPATSAVRQNRTFGWWCPWSLGESVTEAAIRETKEETGIDCEVTGLVGIYSDPKHVILYTSNGEARQEFSIPGVEQDQMLQHADSAMMASPASRW